MNLIKTTIDIQEKLKIVKTHTVQSQWQRVVLLWYHIFWQSSIQRGRHTQLCIITSLNWIIQICSTFTVGFVKLLSTHPIHIGLWGNFPFNSSIPECIIGVLDEDHETSSNINWLYLQTCQKSRTLHSLNTNVPLRGSLPHEIWDFLSLKNMMTIILLIWSHFRT